MAYTAAANDIVQIPGGSSSTHSLADSIASQVSLKST